MGSATDARGHLCSSAGSRLDRTGKRLQNSGGVQETEGSEGGVMQFEPTYSRRYFLLRVRSARSKDRLIPLKKLMTRRAYPEEKQMKNRVLPGVFYAWFPVDRTGRPGTVTCSGKRSCRGFRPRKPSRRYTDTLPLNRSETTDHIEVNDGRPSTFSVIDFTRRYGPDGSAHDRP